MSRRRIDELIKGEGSDDRVDRAEERKRKTAEEQKEPDIVEEDNHANRRQSDKSSGSGLARDSDGAELPNADMEGVESPAQGDKRKT